MEFQLANALASSSGSHDIARTTRRLTRSLDASCTDDCLERVKTPRLLFQCVEESESLGCAARRHAEASTSLRDGDRPNASPAFRRQNAR